MKITIRRAWLAGALGLSLFAGSASAQEAEAAPRRAAAALDADAARPTGAAPAPEARGPLGEPAPAALAAGLTADTEVPVPDTEVPVADREVPAAEEAIPVDGEAMPPVEAESLAVTEGVVDPAPDGATAPGPLGSPVPTPMRRSFLPVARASAERTPIPVLGSAWGLTGQAFVDEQLTHARVVDAQLDAKFDLKALFAERGLRYPPRDLYFRLFKQEQLLEVWVRDAPDAETYTLLREYPICAIPGRLGPKTRVDDFQAPEGFYYIQGFNPESEFHLSLRLNYPNAADRIIGVADAPGGDIYIHGGCSTIGCFPMTDESMAELYWLAVEARGAGQTVIPVHVFPARLESGAMRWLSATFARDRQLVAFWENLREGYAYFEEHRRLPVITVDSRGRYLFSDPAVSEPVVEFGTVEPDGLLGEPLEPAEPAAAVESAEPAAEVESAEPAAEVESAEPAAEVESAEPVAEVELEALLE